MLGMSARKRANAKGAEKFLLVEHRRQHAAELGFVEDGSEDAAVLPALAGIVDECGELRARAEPSAQALADFGIFADELSVEHGGGAEREQADHRADF
jgi:hypothetical protein